MFKAHAGRIIAAAFLLLSSASAFADDLVSAVLPLSRSPVVGQAATAFATVINTSGKALSGCTVTLPGFPGTFAYRTTDPSTNAVVGGANQPFSLAIGAAQTLIVSLQLSSPLAPTDEHLVFQCTGSAAAASIIGVNTLLLSVNATAQPDVIALVATPSADGTLRTAGAGAAQAFSVATVNVGAGGPITVTADTGDVTLPVQITLCQTNPNTGACLSPPAASVPNVTIAQNATPTFSVFVTPQTAIPFFPSVVRLSVRFKDAGGTTRGSTSVALSTGSTLTAGQTAGGYYVGNYRITSGVNLGETAQAEFLIAEDGEMRGVTFDPFQTGALATLYSAQAIPTSPLLFSSTGTIISVGDYTLANNTTESPISISGAVSPHSLISGIFSISGTQQTGEFYAVYSANRYERPSSLSMIAGAWTIRDGGSNAVGSVTVSANGSFTGTSPSGCGFTGTASTIDTRYNVYRLSLTVPTSCPGEPAGTYRGLGTFFDGRTANDSFRLVVGSTNQAITSYITRY